MRKKIDHLYRNYDIYWYGSPRPDSFLGTFIRHNTSSDPKLVDLVNRLFKWIVHKWDLISAKDWHDIASDSNAYNTGWTASLHDNGTPLFPRCVRWRENRQYSDG